MRTFRFPCWPSRNTPITVQSGHNPSSTRWASIAAQGRSQGAHALRHMAVSHLRADDATSRGLDREVNPQVALDRDDERPFGERPAGERVHGEEGEDLVAVKDLTALVAEDAAVSVAVVGRAEPGSGREDEARQGLGVLASDPLVDVPAVRPVPDARKIRPERAEDGRGRRRGGAVCGVERDLPSLERSRGQHPHGRVNVGGHHRVGGQRPAGIRLGPAGPIRASIAASSASVSFAPSGPKNLMPLSAAGLCEAVTAAPRTARPSVVARETAGVVFHQALRSHGRKAPQRQGRKSDRDMGVWHSKE